MRKAIAGFLAGVAVTGSLYFVTKDNSPPVQGPPPTMKVERMWEDGSGVGTLVVNDRPTRVTFCADGFTCE